MSIAYRWKRKSNDQKNFKKFFVSYNSFIYHHISFIYHIHQNFEDYNPSMKRKVLIVFDDMIADMKASKKNKPYSH